MRGTGAYQPVRFAWTCVRGLPVVRPKGPCRSSKKQYDKVGGKVCLFFFFSEGGKRRDWWDDWKGCRGTW